MEGCRSDSDTYTDDGFGDSGFALSIPDIHRAPPYSSPVASKDFKDVGQLCGPDGSHFYSPGFSSASTRQDSGSTWVTDWGSDEWEDGSVPYAKGYWKMDARGPYPPGAFNHMVGEQVAPDGHAKGGGAPEESPTSLLAALQKNSKGANRPRGSRMDPMSWDEGVTTVMIRHIPRKYCQLRLVEEVSRRGFAGLFDFIYLPFDFKKGANVGYGFVNFINTEHAKTFRDVFDGSFLEPQPSDMSKPLHVHPASVQGYEANYQHFAQTKTGQKQDPQISPLFFPQLAKRRQTAPIDDDARFWQEDERPPPAPPPRGSPVAFGSLNNQMGMARLPAGQLPGQVFFQGQVPVNLPPGHVAVPVAAFQVPQVPQAQSQTDRKSVV